jgi:hypothetical protein
LTSKPATYRIYIHINQGGYHGLQTHFILLSNVCNNTALWPTIIEVDGVKTSGDLIALQFKPLSQTIPNLTDLHKVTLTIDSAKVAASSTVTFGGLPK